MKILISVSHPAHVHLFKNLIWKLQKDGDSVKIVAREKDKTVELLDKYRFDYTLISKAETNPVGFFKEMIKRTFSFFKIIRDFQPDICLTQMDPSPAIASKLSGVPYICLADSEPAKLILYGTLPFTKAVLTPDCFRTDIGRKQIRYNGYKELAYLHTDIFTPDPSVLDEIGISKGEPYTILRFVSWGAHHDIGRQGIQNKLEIVKELEKYGRVFISSEKQLDETLKQYQLNVSSEKIHSVLYYAQLLFCDSQTMTTEAGVLGTPAVRCNSFVGDDDMGNFIELENKYHLIYNFNDESKALDFALSLINKPHIKEEWSQKRQNLLDDKIDVTKFLIWFIENYPESAKQLKENPDIQKKF